MIMDMSLPPLKWPPLLDDNGASLPQLISHEYILRSLMLNSATGPRLPMSDSSEVSDKSECTNKSKHAWACLVSACHELFPGLQFSTGSDDSNACPDHSIDKDDEDLKRATELLSITTPALLNISELKVPKFHVGIIGAGMAGLYTAMILESLGISYQILEASDRIGGRVYTHRFSNDPGDYYDAGAMRFPDTPAMGRTFRLFRQLGIEKKEHVTFDKYLLTAGKKRKDTHNREYQRQQFQKHGDLIPYFIKGQNTPSYFNDSLVVVDSNPQGAEQEQVDPYSFSTVNGGTVPLDAVIGGPTQIIDKIFKDWRNDFEAHPHLTLTQLYEKDKKAVTVRQEVMENLESAKFLKSLGFDVSDNLELPRFNLSERYYISNWAETMDGSTCSFDGALIESFIHSIDFEYPTTPAVDPPPTPNNANTWWCLNGGADILAQEMTKNIVEANIKKNSRVTGIRKHPIASNRPMRVLVEGNPTEVRYSHVIATTTTPCLQAMDLTGVRMQTDQREALRVLRYEAAVKLGIKFSRKWWIKMGIKRGGQGKTDRPTRCVVYPSYSLHESEDCEGVLLACYNNSTDATRLGALARGNDPTNQKLILDVVLHDLALMHSIEYRTLRDLVVAHHFHDWSRDEFTVGSWGNFGPGQFSNFFSSLQVPAAGGNLLFAGELTSIYHGWIVASLNSAHRAVYLMLLKEGEYSLLEKLTEKWGNLTEHDIPSAISFVCLAQREEEFARIREEKAADREKAAADKAAAEKETRRRAEVDRKEKELARLVEETINQITGGKEVSRFLRGAIDQITS